MKVSPYGMDQCCICDTHDVTHAIQAEDGTWLPYCAEDAKAHKDAFPKVPVMLFSPKEVATTREP